MNNIILFDGECNFCDSSVQFIIKRDPKGKFRFTSLQGESGQKLLNENQIPSDINSFLLIKNNKIYDKSTAALLVAKELKGFWKLICIFIIIPSPIRDFFYNIVSNNRYKWFGKKEVCTIPSPEMRSRFLD